MNENSLTPKQVAEYADKDSRALSETRGDDLLREIAYRMSSDVRSLCQDHYRAAVTKVLAMTPEEIRGYSHYSDQRLIDDNGQA